MHLNNFNLAEKSLKKGLLQTEGMLGNDVIYKVSAFNINFYLRSTQI